MKEFRILGPLEVIDDGAPIEIGRPKERAVLAMLAAEPGRAVSADRLIEGLWGDRPPATAIPTLRTYVSHLRAALADAGDSDLIETIDSGYRLAIEPEQIDSVRFADLVRRGDRAMGYSSYQEASAAFAEALTMWRGPALADLPDDDRARIESHRLDALRIHALEERINADLHLGKHGEVIGDLEALVAQHPLSERFAELLMTALYRSGRQAEALHVYQTTRATLGDQLGIEPGRTLQKLEEEILLQDPALDLEIPVAPSKHNLPAPLTSFVDREDETRALNELLRTARLVTLTGTGGSGKTRLAMETAAQLVVDHRHGAWWVDFGSIRRADLVAVTAASILLPREMAEAMNLTADSDDLVDILADYLKPREILLILDNCEHLAAALASLTTRLLESAPELRVIATSREPLHVEGEHLLRVTPLRLPAPDATGEELDRSDAVKLFLDRARARDPDFSSHDLSGVAEICRRLDGIPLAIELAAGRLTVMSVEEIAAHLDDRFSVLVGGSRSALPRHRTVRETIDWSYHTLSEDEKCLFQRCSLFVGTFTLEAAEAVSAACGQTLHGLGNLVEKSLVSIERKSGSTGYRLLETIREYGLEQLAATGEVDQARAEYAAYYARLAERAEPFLLTSQRDKWLNRLEAEHSNLIAALDWATTEGRADAALLIAASLWRFWQARGQLNGAGRWIDEALRIPGGSAQTRAAALEARGGVAYWQGHFDKADQVYREALQLRRELGSQIEIARALYNASYGAAGTEDMERAHTYLAESLELAEEAGSSLDVAKAYWGFVNLAWLEGDPKESIGYGLRAAEIFEEHDAPYDLGWAQFMLAQAHYDRGDLVSARVHLADGLRAFARTRDQSAAVLFLSLKAAILFDEGNEEDGGHLLGAMQEIKNRSGATLADLEARAPKSLIEVLHHPSPIAERAMAHGRTLTLDEAISLAATT